MSYILIKNMEMPESCYKCPLSRSGCSAVMKRVKTREQPMTWIPWNYRHDDCPLVEVPSSDVTELKSGRWIKTVGENGVTSACRCSNCGFGDNRYSLFSYCPICGARMDGE